MSGGDVTRGRARGLPALLEIMHAIAGYRRRDELFRAISDAVKPVLGADRVGIVLVEADRSFKMFEADASIAFQAQRVDEVASGVGYQDKRVAELVSYEQVAGFPGQKEAWDRHGVRASI